MRKPLLGSAFLVLLCAQSFAIQDASTRKMDEALKGYLSKSSKPLRVRAIVQFNGALAPADRKAIKKLDVKVVRELPIINGTAVTLPLTNLRALASKGFVRRLSWDGKVEKNDGFTVESSLASVAWGGGYSLNGAGVTVAVIDSGVVYSDDLAGRVLYPRGFAGATQPYGVDRCGHGTHVAGIVAGNGNRSTGTLFTQTFKGVAPGASILNIPVLGPEGQGTVSNVIDGIQWLVDNKSSVYPPVRVLNLSLGHPVGESYKTDPLCLAVEAAWKSGITVVCAAGNAGRLNSGWTSGTDNEGYGTAYGSVNSPGNDPLVITVGATKSLDGIRANDRIATYSSRGPSRLDFVLKPDIVAPGNRVVSLHARHSYLDQTYFATNGVKREEYMAASNPAVSRDYFRMSGTSMATPVVAGAVAMMLQNSPGLTPDTVKARLMFSADKWLRPDGLADPCTYGAGYLNIPAALASTVTPTTPTVSPTLYQDKDGNVAFSPTGLFGEKAIWGSGVSDLRCIWGTKAIWGSTSIVDANRMIWGNSVWTNRAVWGVSNNNADISSVVLKGE